MPTFNSYKGDIITGAVSLSGDCAANLIRVILLSASWTPDIDANLRYGNISAHEINVADPGRIVGYVAGGQAISAATFAVDNTNDRGTWDAPDNTWPSSTISARYLVVVKVRASGANKELDNLVLYQDFGSTQSSSNGSYTIQWNANGILGVS